MIAPAGFESKRAARPPARLPLARKLEAVSQGDQVLSCVDTVNIGGSAVQTYLEGYTQEIGTVEARWKIKCLYLAFAERSGYH